MNTKKYICLNLFVLLMLCTWLLVNHCLASTAKSKLLQDQRKADRLVEKINVSETLGPLAPVAMSPFFGLTCLSGTSILCNKGVLPENSFLIGNDTLNNGFVFLAFLALTVITSVPKLVTASKVFAEITDRLETYAGIISYGVILLLAEQAQPADQETVLYTAGILTLTQNGLLACAAAVNIFVISTVRFFFELLVLISPIPTLDAIFEFTNKAIAGLLAIVYAFNPFAAFVLNLIIFFICFLIFKWANRRIKYLRAILLEPMILSLKRKISRNKDYDPDHKARDRFAHHLPDADLLLKCFPMRKLGKIKKKDLCYLLLEGNNPVLLKPRFLRAPVIKKLNREQLETEIKEGLMSYSVTCTDDSGRRKFDLVFGSAYKQNLEALKSKLNRPKSQ